LVNPYPVNVENMVSSD